MTPIPANEGLVFKEEAYAIVGAAMEVHSCLGPGFLEAVYGDAFAMELTARDIPFEREVSIDILYKGKTLPHRYQADFVAYGCIIIELKAIRALGDIEKAQTINYLKATANPLALLVNFGSPKLEWTRLVNTH